MTKSDLKRLDEIRKFYATMPNISFLLDLVERQALVIDEMVDSQNYTSKQLGIAEDALTSIYYMTTELQPNSGHMYLADINTIHKEVCEALEKLK